MVVRALYTKMGTSLVVTLTTDRPEPGTPEGLTKEPKNPILGLSVSGNVISRLLLAQKQTSGDELSVDPFEFESEARQRV